MNKESTSTGYLRDAIFDIIDVHKGSDTPGWVDGKQPLVHQLLLFAAQGELTLIADGAPTIVEHDCVYMYSPGSILELRAAAGTVHELYAVSFEMYRISETTGRSRTFDREDQFPLTGAVHMNGSFIKRSLIQLADEWRLEGLRNRFLGQQYLHDVLEAMLLATAPVLRSDLEDRLKLTIDYMQSHYREPIRVEKLAELAQLHPSYYSQVFKQTMDKTPVAFLTHLRMNKAKELLLLTDKPVRDIAAEVGYGDEFYFSRRFKETNGYSPSIYIKKNDIKIISLSAPYTDHLFTLGIIPCAAQMHRYLPLNTYALSLPQHASEPWVISRQAFIEMKPDLIVCKDNVLAMAREHINDIAPIISIPWARNDVFWHLLEIAQLVNRKQEALEWMDKHEQQSEQVRKKVQAAFGEGTVALLAIKKNQLRMYGERNIGHVFYRSLELSPPEKVRERLDCHPAGSGYNWSEITAGELLRQYDSDFLFIIPQTEADRELAKQLLRTAWTQHGAVQHKRVYFLEWDKWIAYAPYMLDRQLEELEQLFG